MLERYFDNAATSPLDPRALQEMTPWLTEKFGNANSLHTLGREAREAVEKARGQVAQAIGASDAEQIIFTSGATEGNNWVLKSFVDGAISPFEHSSIWETAKECGFEVLENEELRLVPPESSVSLISVMSTNNEIGSQFCASRLRPHCEVLHSDITQAACKYETDLTGLDYATFSAHKFYGPKGVGALYMLDSPLPPLMNGGEQEYGLRAGTLNVAGIVGMGIAAQLAAEQRDADSSKAQLQKQLVLDQLEGVDNMVVNGGLMVASHILSISFLGIEGESLVIELDSAGFAISSGAACSSGSTEPSHVLTALGIEPEWLRGTVRISFGRFNTDLAAIELGKELKRAVYHLRALRTWES